MKNFKIEVWYRYTSYGELEKDFETHIIIAENLQNAINLTSDIYKNKNAIPFKFFYNKIEVYPSVLTKNEIYKLTNPKNV